MSAVSGGKKISSVVRDWQTAPRQPVAGPAGISGVIMRSAFGVATNRIPGTPAGDATELVVGSQRGSNLNNVGMALRFVLDDDGVDTVVAVEQFHLLLPKARRVVYDSIGYWFMSPDGDMERHTPGRPQDTVTIAFSAKAAVFAFGFLWAIDDGSNLKKINVLTASPNVVTTVAVNGATDIAVDLDNGLLWISGGNSMSPVIRVDPNLAGLPIVVRYDVLTEDPFPLTVGNGSVWMLSASGLLMRVDPNGGGAGVPTETATLATSLTGYQGADVLYDDADGGAGKLWACDGDASSLAVRIDAGTFTEDGTVAVQPRVRSLARFGDHVWASGFDGITRVAASGLTATDKVGNGFLVWRPGGAFNASEEFPVALIKNKESGTLDNWAVTDDSLGDMEPGAVDVVILTGSPVLTGIVAPRGNSGNMLLVNGALAPFEVRLEDIDSLAENRLHGPGVGGGGTSDRYVVHPGSSVRVTYQPTGSGGLDPRWVIEGYRPAPDTPIDGFAGTVDATPVLGFEYPVVGVDKAIVARIDLKAVDAVAGDTADWSLIARYLVDAGGDLVEKDVTPIRESKDDASWDYEWVIAGVAATQRLHSSSGTISNNDTVTIDGKVYTFQTVLTDVDGNVQIAGATNDSLTNLSNAINLTGTPGTDYALSMTVHPTVTGSKLLVNQLAATAKTPGAGGNTIAVSETFAPGVFWFGSTLADGSSSFRLDLTGDAANPVTWEWCGSIADS